MKRKLFIKPANVIIFLSLMQLSIYQCATGAYAEETIPYDQYVSNDKVSCNKATKIKEMLIAKGIDTAKIMQNFPELTNLAPDSDVSMFLHSGVVTNVNTYPIYDVYIEVIFYEGTDSLSKLLASNKYLVAERLMPLEVHEFSYTKKLDMSPNSITKQILFEKLPKNNIQSSPASDAQDKLSLDSKMNAEIGNSSYEDFVSRLGEPTTTSGNEESFSAQWIERGTTFILTFDKKTRKLSKWNLITPQNRPRDQVSATQGFFNSLGGFTKNVVRGTLVTAGAFASSYANVSANQPSYNSYPNGPSYSGSANALHGSAANDVCDCKGYDGPGGPCYAGAGGPAYAGAGGPAYAGAGGPCYAGAGGPEYAGAGGPAYDGAGGPRYAGAGGPAYAGAGGPAYAGAGGPCYAGPGGPCYSGPGGSGANCPSVC